MQNYSTLTRLDNKIVKPEPLTRRLLGIALVVILVVGAIAFGLSSIRESDPYIQAVLHLTGDPLQGQAIFQMNCAGCHGVEAMGRVGPSLQDISGRKSQRSLIYQVISGKTPPMPQFQPSPQEMADLLSFLEKL